MSFRYKSQIVAALYSAMLVFTGCDNAEYQEMDNAVYITKAETSQSDKIVIGEKACDYFFAARLANKANSEVAVNLDIDQSVLDAYNKSRGKTLKMLPQKYFEILNQQVSIKAGEINSEPIGIKIKTLGQDLLPTEKYAIPVSIIDVKGGVTVLESSRSLVVELQRIVKTNVASFKDAGDRTRMDAQLKEKYDCDQWTVEFRLKVDDFNANNRAVFWATEGVKGQDGFKHHLYTRFGDVVIDTDQFQIKGVNTQVNTDTKFVKDTWYHFAMVFDGATFRLYVDGEINMNIGAEAGKIYSIDGLGFGKFNGDLSELRFYNKAIPQAQIKDNMYNVIDPKTAGLIGYWRLDEGEGKVFHDLANGNDITFENFTWEKGVNVPDVEL